MSRIVKICVALFMCIALSSAQGEEFPWKLSKDDNGIQVYSRPVKGSDLLEFEAITVIPASLAVLGAVLADVPNYPQWMSNCKESTIIREVDETTLMVYYVQTLPWPIANRDVVLMASTTLDWNKMCMEVLMQAMPDPEVPVLEKKVRMHIFSGRMYFEQIQDNQTRVTFRINADPAGSLPASGVNAGALNVPYRTLTGMKEMAGKKKYIEAAEDYRKNMTADKS